MKSAVETLGPTRIKLTVEVPFDELQPAVNAAYTKIAQQVRVKGFRPGKVPPRLIDQQVGRGAVLEEAINEAVPGLYGDAVREQEIEILGQPEIEVTKFTDGEELVFTAEVDVRPEIALPEYDGLAGLGRRRGRCRRRGRGAAPGSARPVRDTRRRSSGPPHPATTSSIDLSATIDGEAVEDAVANNLSYEVGSDALVPGLDDAIAGLSVGESKDFETQLRSGDAGWQRARRRPSPSARSRRSRSPSSTTTSRRRRASSTRSRSCGPTSATG